MSATFVAVTGSLLRCVRPTELEVLVMQPLQAEFDTPSDPVEVRLRRGRCRVPIIEVDARGVGQFDANRLRAVETDLDLRVADETFFAPVLENIQRIEERGPASRNCWNSLQYQSTHFSNVSE